MQAALRSVLQPTAPSSAKDSDQNVDLASIDARLAKLQSFLQAARAGRPTILTQSTCQSRLQGGAVQAMAHDGAVLVGGQAIFWAALHCVCFAVKHAARVKFDFHSRYAITLMAPCPRTLLQATRPT